MGDRRFGKRKNDRPRDDSPRFSRGSQPPFRPRDPRFEKRDSEQPFEKRMYSATCAACGQRCEIPFRPREGGKPVYCSTCFRKDGNYEPRRPLRPAPASTERSGLDQINEKLDKIMRALDIK